MDTLDPPQMPAEEELVEGCRRHDREAQRQVYLQTSPRVYGLLRRLTRSEDEAFDLAQETYLRAFTQIGQFDGRSSLATWICRIAINEALRFLRRAAAARTRQRLLGRARLREAGGPPGTARLDVEEALEALPAEDRVILLLRYHQGLGYRAIAAVIGCPEGTVASRLNRALQRLRARLRRDYGPQEDTTGAAHPTCGGASAAQKRQGCFVAGRLSPPGPQLP